MNFDPETRDSRGHLVICHRRSEVDIIVLVTRRDMDDGIAVRETQEWRAVVNSV